ncbi:ketopantoate reductase family protein [Pseudooceanicola sp. HF7]|uniref:ketopantoate reductase family protein n=1 Tax=Pseudooceanicola sp. HF7 TaxID=2721560 RepID=UPI0014314E82|nr:2-dehydropantoate 2-reductase [Pseudooceanicola sp. HF7]NIZ08061.1 2-dehydropantoate 2-reductase [Pseudooceanicola sp. HF7]
MSKPSLPPLPDRPLSIAIIGAGAIGGAVAAELAAGAEDAGIASISIVARGPHLAAIQEKGLRISTPSHPKPRSFAVHAVEDPADLPPQDLVITALKGHQLPAMADKIAGLLLPHSRVMSIVNGLPWWYPVADGQGGTKGAEEVDPGGVLWKAIGPERAIGAIAFLSANVPEPGLIERNNEGYYDLGRLPGQDRADVVRVAGLMRAAGFDIKETQPYQNALWTKLMSNAGMNSTCAVAQAPISRALADPALFRLAVGIMSEVYATGKAEGVDFPYGPEQRAAAARDTLDIKPSTLQDLEAGRPMEIDPIFAAAISVAKSHGIDAPNLELVTAILRSIDTERHG